MNMRFICVQPRLIYYAWQVEVMLNNFIRLGINPNKIEILYSININPSDPTNNVESVKMWDKLKNKYSSVRFFQYYDTRNQTHYIPSIVFNLLKQHFLLYPELEREAIFLHDSDIVFTRTPYFDNYLKDNISYLSNTNGYINSSYVLSKGEHIYNTMCDIVGIDKRIPKIMNSNSGGAQYILKGINAEFWIKVEKDSIKLYNFFLEEEKKILSKNPHYHPIQKWTAGMWSLLYNLWYLGKETKVDKYLNFCWATDNIQEWNKNLIYHNAGVVNPNSKLFFKGNYINNLPYDDVNIKYTLEDNYDHTKCSINYIKEIIETSKNSCLI